MARIYYQRPFKPSLYPSVFIHVWYSIAIMNEYLTQSLISIIPSWPFQASRYPPLMRIIRSQSLPVAKSLLTSIAYHTLLAPYGALSCRLHRVNYSMARRDYVDVASFFAFCAICDGGGMDSRAICRGCVGGRLWGSGCKITFLSLRCTHNTVNTVNTAKTDRGVRIETVRYSVAMRTQPSFRGGIGRLTTSKILNTDDNINEDSARFLQ